MHAMHLCFRGLALLTGAALAACSSDDGGTAESPAPFTPADPATPAGTSPGAASGAGGAANMDVGNYDRPAGMPIGQGASGSGESPAAGEGTALDPGVPADDAAEGDDEIAIPVFEDDDVAPPCVGCVELQMLVNDINQRDEFMFSVGGMAGVTRVTWSIIVPFNSDQLFVQPFVDSAYGTYTDLDANAFAIDTPAQFVHTLAGATSATNVGLAIGSAGAWTGDMVMSLYVDSVTIEANGTSVTRSFEAGVEGLDSRTSAHQPQVVFHP
jgi:hypothetical protein